MRVYLHLFRCATYWLHNCCDNCEDLRMKTGLSWQFGYFFQHSCVSDVFMSSMLDLDNMSIHVLLSCNKGMYLSTRSYIMSPKDQLKGIFIHCIFTISKRLETINIWITFQSYLMSLFPMQMLVKRLSGQFFVSLLVAKLLKELLLEEQSI